LALNVASVDCKPCSLIDPLRNAALALDVGSVDGDTAKSPPGM
jgi:hypothetical protein